MFALLLTAIQAQRPTLSQMVPPAMKVIQYKLLSSPPSLSREPKPRFADGKHLLFAFVLPKSRRTVWCYVEPGRVAIDLNGDGIIGTSERTKLKVDARTSDRVEHQTIALRNNGVESAHIVVVYKRDISGPPFLKFGAAVDKVDRVFRSVICRPSLDWSKAPVFDLAENPAADWNHS